MYPKGRIQPEPEPTYYGTARFNGFAIELWRSTYSAKGYWYARYDGMSESEFRGTRSNRPADAIGHAILASDENSELSDRLYS